MTEELMSQEKFEELTSELGELRTTRRKEIAEQLEYARGLGDLSENAEYQEAREMQAAIEDRIGKLEHILKNAKIVKEGKKSGTVAMGSSVTVQPVAAKGSEDKRTYIIVGAEETDMFAGKISYHSPLGSALLNKKKGDEFSFHTPRGTQRFKILKVE
ncbi:transcription elongation factor GreA [Candidatus Adlerbacteria bacterium RIFCSPHIGHO2_12_FULL_53_18]|uniref:Transcription elongation factor GreA n=2 Tax=Parcubacteria group TaxID=1794811 RepID=A0A1F4XS17_9BACT|nr:MAG: transcription elongation factor GreA [Candidatus Adlerbacteria bacterium RIFCSPHIGHO2_12_FULL_53_18]OGG51266.1 MAG: transcription elongation factor GreA [Candidatus Kaiserbacteria bacterium RIFCSPHIGHO2_01_FULL_54_36b]